MSKQTNQKRVPKVQTRANKQARAAMAPSEVWRPSMPVGANAYAAALFDPEGNPGAAVPDAFHAPTHRFNTVESVFIPIIAGEFQAIVTPTLDANFWLPDEDYAGHQVVVPLFTADSRDGSFSAWCCNQKAYEIASRPIWSGNMAMFDLDDDSWALQARTDDLMLVPRVYSSGSNIHKYWPMTPTGASTSMVHFDAFIYGYAITADPDTVSLVAHPEWMMANGTTVESNITLSYVVSQVTEAATTGTMCKIRVTAGYNVPVGAIGLISCTLETPSAMWVENFQVCADARYPAFALFEAHSVTNFDRYCGQFKGVRPVAQSAWFSYRGPTLEGGSIAGRLLSGVESPASTAGTPYLPYPNLSAIPGTYDGKVNDGAWCTWRPQDVNAYSFAPANGLANNLSLGCIIVAGSVTTDSPDPVKLRLVTAWEVFATDPTLTLIPSPTDPAALSAALVFISRLPAVIPNDTHLEKIKGWLAQFARKAWDNRQAIADAARGAYDVAKIMA